ncbi:MAG: hypothetical protein JKY49_16200 [Cohaesibacteraceae bacterium]|nr:hypothetical protein [Cohaesibacteraceae bacterium]
MFVTDPFDNAPGVAKAGAAYLFDSESGKLLTTWTGSYADDQVADDRHATFTLDNGNLIFSNHKWNSKAGAVTFVNPDALTGGIISASNSLVGKSINDSVGTSQGIHALGNGYYAIRSPGWNQWRGAVTVFKDTTGVTGYISNKNSFTGTNNNDRVGGYYSVEVLDGGYFAIKSQYWNNKKGAVTIFANATDIKGELTEQNSLTGTKENDEVGGYHEPIQILGNGYAAITSEKWDEKRGAVTVFKLSEGISGKITKNNSFIGKTKGDQVGFGGVQALGEDFVAISSPRWGDSYGAVTVFKNSAGISGEISSQNSLVGSHKNDVVGAGFLFIYPDGSQRVKSAIQYLGNGFTAITSRHWHKVRGAVTIIENSNPVTGPISNKNSFVGVEIHDSIGSHGIHNLTGGYYAISSIGERYENGFVTVFKDAGENYGDVTRLNSLVGKRDDEIGSGGVKSLGNGYSAILSPAWTNGTGTQGIWRVGAVTVFRNSDGIKGEITKNNSLVGTWASDGIGSSGIQSLGNGYHAIRSPYWNKVTGAITVFKNTGRITGEISSQDSLIGTYEKDQLGSYKITILGNGKFAVSTPYWNKKRGAVTVFANLGDINGKLSEQQSFTGETENDQVGNYGIRSLENGYFAIISPYWDKKKGAITVFANTAEITGKITKQNSFIGKYEGDLVGDNYYSLQALSDGNFAVITGKWNNNRGAITVFANAASIKGEISEQNSLTGTDENDSVGYNQKIKILGNGHYAITSHTWHHDNHGAVSIFANAKDIKGKVSAQNSLIGKTKNGHLSYVTYLPKSKSVVARSWRGQRIIIGLLEQFPLNYSRASGRTITMTSSFIERTLSRGQNVVLQASNDIEIKSDIITVNVSGNGGDLLLQAGRSILVDADITTDNGNLELRANDLLSAGVIDEDREDGAATIRLASGVNLLTGTGNIDLKILSGTGKKYKSAGNINLVGNNALTGKNIQLLNLGDELNNGIVLGAGTQFSASGTSTAITLVSDVFTNNAGANVFDLSSSDRFLVYSKNWGTGVRGGIIANNLYNRGYASNLPASITSGNHFIYADQPLLTVTANDKSRTYGENNPVFTYTIAGYLDGDSRNNLTGNALVSSTATNQTDAGKIKISMAQGNLASRDKYGFSFLDGTLTIAQRALTWTATAKSKTYNGDTVAEVSFTTTNTANNDVLTLAGTSTYNDKNTGTVKNINISKLVLGGSKAANYTYEKSGKTTGKITQRDLTVTVKANNKIYDGNRDATSFSFSDDTLDADTLTFGITSALFDSKNAGKRNVTVSGITILSGDNNKNYKLTTTSATDMAEITKFGLKIQIKTKSKVYDGTDVAEVSFGSNALDIDTLVFTKLSALFNDKNVGKKQVAIKGISILSGDDANNYYIVQPNGQSQAEIKQAELIIAAQNETKTADSVPYSGGPGIVLAGLVNGETVADLNGVLTWSGTSQGAVNVGNYLLTAGGLKSGNYNISYVDGTLDIRPVPISAQETTRPEYLDLNLGGLFAALSQNQDLENFETADIGDGTSIPLLICDGDIIDCRNIEVSSLLQ